MLLGRRLSYGAVVSELVRIRWAPMLSSSKLIRLYEANAAGTLADELVDDVGWRLWERLADVVRVTNGRVRCPVCGTEFQVRTPERQPDDLVQCDGCDWVVTPGQWHKSWENRDLNGWCHEFQRFVDRWPSARSVGDRMVMIDTVVHALHVSSREDSPGNFAARNFLEGSRPKVVALLDELALGPGSRVADGARRRWSEARELYRNQHRR